MTHAMLSINPVDLPPADAYRLLLSAIIPRPIAWISTLAADGTPNLAPYSFFNGVSGNPPTVMFSVSQRSPRLGGGNKDTLVNVQQTGEFVVNLVDDALAAAMNETAGEYGPEVDEFTIADLATAPSVDIKTPRVALAPVAMEARVSQVVPVEGSTSVMVLGQIVRLHVREDLLRANNQIDAAVLRPVARLGGREYAHLGEIFTLDRPQVPRP